MTKLTVGVSARDKRNETRRTASRVIRNYRAGKPIADGDALTCAMAAAELLRICEDAINTSVGGKRG